MQEIRAKVITRLLNDATLYPSLVTGGIYDRPLKQGKGQGATPAAFWQDPLDAAHIWRLRESIVVAGPNEVDPPDGPIDVGPGPDPVLRNGFLTLNYYVPATSTGKANLDLIDARVLQLLSGWQMTLTTGYPITVTVGDMTEDRESQAFPGNLQAIRNISAEYLRAAA